jgi:1,2-diacylglycerol 3-alpha-glucosyltransferase
LKIVYATDNYWPRVSGMAVSIDTFRHELTQLGHEVHVLVPWYPGRLQLTRKAGRRNVHRLRSFRVPFSSEDRLALPNEKKRIFARLDALRPDLIHVQTEFTMGRLALRYAITRGLPLVISCHTYFEQYFRHYVPFFPQPFISWATRWYSRRFFNKAHALVVPSEHMRSVLVEYGVTSPTAIIPTGFEHSRFAGINREQERQSSFLYEQYPQLKGRKIVLTVCRLGKEKNVDFLLDVFARVAPDVPDAMWLLVGDGPHREGLLARIQKEGLEQRVVMTGYVPRERIKHVFALGDVFAFASKTESQGLVTVEAMSCGTPVVALGEMGTRDVMAGDNGGFMVGEDVTWFATRVRDLLTNQVLHQRKSIEALQYSQRWNASALAEKMLRLYHQVIEHRDAVPSQVESMIQASDARILRASGDL